MSDVYEVTTIILRTGLDDNRLNITPSEGELLYTKDSKQLFVGDGSTAGGNRVSGGTISIGDVEIELIAGPGLIGGGPFGEHENIIELGTPETLNGFTTNSSYNNTHTHELEVSADRDITNNSTLLLARSMKDHIDIEHSGSGNSPGDIPEHTHDHDTLDNYDIYKHVDHQNVDIVAGDGILGGGNILNSIILDLGVPSTLDGNTNNTVSSTSHSHKITVSGQRNITDNNTILLAKAMKDHIDNEPHISETHNHDHNLLNNYNSNQHINHQSLDIVAGNGIVGGGTLTQSRTLNLGTPSNISGTTQNTTTENSHTHRIIATDSRTVTTSDKLLLAKALRDHIIHEPHVSADGTDHNHDHNFLINYESSRHVNHQNVSINPINGLEGGGNISQNVTISLTMPGDLSGTTENNNSDNHTHKLLSTDNRNVTDNHQLLLAKAMKDHIDEEEHVIPDGSNHDHDHNGLLNYVQSEHFDHENISILGKNGLEGGGLLTESHDIIMKQPGTLSGESVNDNTSNHTHEILSTDARDVEDDEQLLLAKALKTHLDEDSHISIDHDHDHNALSNVYISEHVNHEDISIVGINGLEGGGNITQSHNIELVQPGTLSGSSINNKSDNHTHEILATDSREITDDDHILLAKALKFHLDNDPHSQPDDSNHTHNHNNLQNYNSNHHIDHSDVFIVASHGLVGGGSILGTITLELNDPQILSGVSLSDVDSSGHSHEILTTDSREITDSEYLLLAKAMKDHIDEEEHVIPDGSNHDHDHNELSNYVQSEHLDHENINIICGDGLDGGGKISGDVTINMKLPSEITGITSNNIDISGHTHKVKCSSDRDLFDDDTLFLAKGMSQHINTEHASIEIVGGDGLSGGGILTDPIITINMGVPTIISGLSGNELVQDTHTHELLTTDSREMTNDEEYVLLAKAMKDHIDVEHDDVLAIAGDGLLGGGHILENFTINMGTPSIINGISTNTVSQDTHTHELLTTDSREITDGEHILLAKAMKDHIDNEHDDVLAIAGDGLLGGGHILENFTINMGTPSIINGISTNTVSQDTHTHELLTTDSREITDGEHILLAKAMKDHIDNEPHISGLIVKYEENKTISANDYYDISINNALNSIVNIYIQDEDSESTTFGLWVLDNNICKIGKNNDNVRVVNLNELNSITVYIQIFG